MKKYLVEFIGTFIFLFTIGSAVLSHSQMPAVAIGFALMVVVYAGGGISGGHYNPAVSFAAALQGGLSWREVPFYWTAQILGASAAAGLVCLTAAETTAPAEFNVPLLIIGEFVYTFVLCYVVLLTTRTENSYFGLAIGSTVTVGALAVGAVCLAAFNPAVAIGLGIMQIATWKFAAITIAANLAAAAAAACVVKSIFIEK